MTYNFTDFLNANSTFEQVIEIDTSLTGGLLSLLVIVSLFTILFVKMLPYGPRQAFATSSFISAIISALFWISGFADILPMIITLVMTITGIILIFLFE